MSHPKNVRNFWIEVTIDGRSTPIKTGPQRKDGGFELTIYQRDKGEIMKALTIEGTAYGDGYLLLRAVSRSDTISVGTIRD